MNFLKTIGPSGINSVILLAFTSLNLAAQGTAPLRISGTRVPTNAGDIIAEIDPSEAFVSLDQLIQSSDLIVDGTVSTVLPAVLVDSSTSTPLIETRSVISVSDVFFEKKLPSKATSIVLTQVGGSFEGWNVVSKQAPVVVAGERYIFFLRRDARQLSKTIQAPLRYAVVGVWSGLVKIQDSKVTFLASAAPGLHTDDNDDSLTFCSRLRDKVAELKTNRVDLGRVYKLHPGMSTQEINELLKLLKP